MCNLITSTLMVWSTHNCETRMVGWSTHNCETRPLMLVSYDDKFGSSFSRCDVMSRVCTNLTHHVIFSILLHDLDEGFHRGWVRLCRR